MSSKKKTDNEVVDDLDDPKYDTTKESPKTPPVKVGDPAYDWSEHYDTDDLYRHTFGNGTVVALRPFQSILSDTWLYTIRKLQTNKDFQFAAIDRGSCPTAQVVLESLLDSVEGDPIKELFEAWSSNGTKRGDGDEGLTPGN